MGREGGHKFRKMGRRRLWLAPFREIPDSSSMNQNHHLQRKLRIREIVKSWNFELVWRLILWLAHRIQQPFLDLRLQFEMNFFDQLEVLSTSLIHLIAIVYFPQILLDCLKIIKIPDNFFRNWLLDPWGRKISQKVQLFQSEFLQKQRNWSRNPTEISTSISVGFLGQFFCFCKNSNRLEKQMTVLFMKI